MPNESSGGSSVNRATAEGCIWLNDVFRFDNSSGKLFGNKGPRISVLEAFWGTLSAVVVTLVLFGGHNWLGDFGPLYFDWSPLAIIFWSMMAAVFGRRIANMSPLRRRTGEGTGVWIKIQFRKLVIRLSGYVARPVMYNKCISRAGTMDGRPMVVECVEWIGTARAPRMPYDHSPSEDVTLNVVNVQLPPRGRLVLISRRERKLQSEGRAS